LKNLVIDRINSRLTGSDVLRRGALRDNVSSSSLDEEHPYSNKRQKTSKGKNKKQRTRKPKNKSRNKRSPHKLKK
tara:strand:+ start:299 stop:523 length:225 start_codon:yes stop_codon:yes gene_type:complete